MAEFHEYVNEYKKQMQKGAIQKAYKGLMDYVLHLRRHLMNKYPDYVVPGGIYYGYMDMTYFSFFPESLKRQNLKVAIVLNHEAMRFEAWLAGVNKQVQSKFWKLFRESDWKEYTLVATTKGADAIIEHVLVSHPDFRDPQALTGQIERETMKFIAAVEGFLSSHGD